jgi:ribonuclease D
MTGGETPIRDPAALAARVGSWPAGEPVALDTEFVRERTYYPRLCLVQAAVGGDIVLLDVIAIPDGGALVPLLTDPARAKLVHAARQDIEALLPLTAQPIGNVFDTQQAAALLGFNSQAGYAELVRQVLGIELAKGHARTDWARRPLTREQLAYAADDVRYLPALAAELDRRLVAAGRRAWLDEEAAALQDPALYRVDPATAWRRLKGLERLDGASFAAACALAEWRERRAMAKDLPRGWILTDAAILALASAKPRTKDALARISEVPAGTAARAGDEILRLVADAATTAAPRPAGDNGRPGPEQLRLQKVLQGRLAALSTELGIQPEVLATRRELAALARDERDVPVMRGWRRETVGKRLMEVLPGGV